MKRIPFIKCTAYGNNFVVLDEIQAQLLSEPEKLHFAYQATNMYFGIGSDSFLVIQPYKPKILREINNIHHYWDNIPDSLNADYIFRIFEKTGAESSSCGNGLICVANYLYHQYGIEFARIITEIPTSSPEVVTIGTNFGEEVNWVNMGYPRRISPQMAEPSVLTPYNKNIDMVKDITVVFDHKSLPFVKNKTSLILSGYLVFTGEPHVVVFPETEFSLPELANRLFIGSNQEGLSLRDGDNEFDFSTWLVDYIGTYINQNYTNIFPVGMNINFVRIHKNTEILEYRCFERGINRETLACGTGAVAIACVVQSLNMLSTHPVTVWPHCCRWYDPSATIHVKESEKGWVLYGHPIIVFEGMFILR